MLYSTVLKTVSNLQLIPFTFVCSKFIKTFVSLCCLLSSPFVGSWFHVFVLMSPSSGVSELLGCPLGDFGIEVLVLKFGADSGKLQRSAGVWYEPQECWPV